MTGQDPATFEKLTQIEAPRPTLIEGLPGHGLVASIAVDQITEQLDLVHHGNIYDESFPRVVTFQEGIVRDPVRVYSGETPPVMTLQSDLAMPPETYGPLARCVLGDLADDFDRAIFLAGAPAASDAARGNVTGVATHPELRDELEATGIDLAMQPGIVGGVTGALVQACHQQQVPAAVLIVEAHPYLPDPGAAQGVIENALEPLVDFDIDTTELEKQAEEIQQRMQQIAEQYRRTVEDSSTGRSESAIPGMYQ